MFFAEFEDGSIQTESQLGKWDNIPCDARIRRIGMLLPVRCGTSKGALSLCPLPRACERYSCTKLGRMIVGKDNGRIRGYAMMGVKDGTVYRFEMTGDGLGPLKMIAYDDLRMDGRIWRDGC